MDKNDKETSSTKQKWNNLMKDKLMSRIVKDSMQAAGKGEPREVKNPLRGILKRGNK